VNQTTLNDTIIDVLSKQAAMLESELLKKNNQIESLNQSLNDSQQLLREAHQSLHEAQALHSGTITKLLEKKSSFKLWRK